jgi:hypothetical protein
MIKTKFLVFLGGILGLLGSGWVFWNALRDQDMLAIAVTGIYLLGLLGSAWGMWRYRRWAFMLSRILAGAAFALGCYIAHFTWTFWLFREPTLKDRIFSVLRPQVSLFLVVPAFWLTLSFLPKVAGKFRS